MLINTLVLWSILNNSLLAQQEIKVKNNYPYRVQVWTWPKSVESWLNEKPMLESSETGKSKILDNGDHYFMVKDGDREIHVGWVQMNKLELEKKPTLIFGNYQFEKVVTFKIRRPVCEQTTRIVNGQSVPYTIRRYVEESQSKTIHFMAPGIRVIGDGVDQVVKPQMKNRTLGIQAYRCEKGIHVQSVDSGKAGAKCWDSSGAVFTLEKDDHILAINGSVPSSIDEFKSIISSCEFVCELDVLDKDGVTRRRLFAQPR